MDNYTSVYLFSIDYAAFSNKNQTGEKQSYAVILLKYPLYLEDSILNNQFNQSVE